MSQTNFSNCRDKGDFSINCSRKSAITRLWNSEGRMKNQNKTKTDLYSNQTMSTDQTVMCTVGWLTWNSGQMRWDPTMAASSDVPLLSNKAPSHDRRSEPEEEVNYREMMVRWNFNETEAGLILILNIRCSIILWTQTLWTCRMLKGE